MKTSVVGYCPPPHVTGAAAFRQNLEKYPPAGDMILYSDHAYPGVVPIKANPEIFKTGRYIEGKFAGQINPFSIHNALFLCAVAIARSHKVDFLLYIEADCRFACKGWDQIILEEYFSLGRPTIVAGTCSAYNPSSFSQEAARRFAREIGKPRRHGIPVGCYGWLPAAEHGESTWLPNGALAVYDRVWMERFFDLDNQWQQAVQNGPFDQAIAQRIWKMFGEDSFDVIGYLETVYSGYGNVMTSEAERILMLNSRKVCAVHQIKSEWCPP